MTRETRGLARQLHLLVAPYRHEGDFGRFADDELCEMMHFLQLADGIVRYTRKGFKLTEPFLCPRNGCFRAALLDEFERWA